MPKNNKNSKVDQLSDSIDPSKDKIKMKPGIEEINLPDVGDIPGQEDFVPAPLGELADTTISSADEEGEDVFTDDIDEEIEENSDSDVSDTERDDLEIAADDMPGDDESLHQASLDDTDDEGIPLNEESFRDNFTASDLDIPGDDLDDEDEIIGEEDEENNDYSLNDENDIPQDDF